MTHRNGCALLVAVFGAGHAQPVFIAVAEQAIEIVDCLYQPIPQIGSRLPVQEGSSATDVGATAAWAGASEDSVLAMLLSVGGWAFVGLSTSALLLFPGVYLAIVKTIVPSEPSGNLTLWRVRGLAGVVAGLILIYYGVLAL